MTLKYTCFLLILLANLALFSQGPGYMGKHFTVGYGINFSPVTVGTNAQNKTLFYRNGSAEGHKLVFNLIHEGYLEYALSTRCIFGASVRYYRTTYDNRKDVFYKTSTFGSNYRPTSYYNIKGITFTPYFKIFKRAAVAPWGRYFLFGVALNTVRTSYDAYMNVPGQVMGHDTLMSDFGAARASRLMPDLLLGWGRTRVIANRFTIDYGFNFQPLTLMVPMLNFLSLETKQLTNDNYIAETSRWRARGVNRFNFYIRFGLLW